MSDDSVDPISLIAGFFGAIGSLFTSKIGKVILSLVAIYFVGAFLYYYFDLDYKDLFRDTSLSNVTTIYTQNGNYYFGEHIDHKANGFGLLKFKNGNHYWGNFADDKLNGYGLYYTKDKNYSEIGEWKNGLNINKSIIIDLNNAESIPILRFWENGNVIKTANLISYVDKDGNKWYTEKAKNDNSLQLGMVKSDNFMYYGYIKNGKFNGFGRTFGDETRFYGHFKNNQKNGYFLKQSDKTTFQFYRKNELIMEKEF